MEGRGGAGGVEGRGRTSDCEELEGRGRTSECEELE